MGNKLKSAVQTSFHRLLTVRIAFAFTLCHRLIELCQRPMVAEIEAQPVSSLVIVASQCHLGSFETCRWVHHAAGWICGRSKRKSWLGRPWLQAEGCPVWWCVSSWIHWCSVGSSSSKYAESLGCHLQRRDRGLATPSWWPTEKRLQLNSMQAHSTGL